MKISYLIKYVLPGVLPVILICFFSFNTLLNLAQNKDFNVSPKDQKDVLYVSLTYKDTLTLPSFTAFNIPVKMQTGYEIAALTLGFYFPAAFLEVTGVEMANGIHGFNYNINDSVFLITWSDIIPVNMMDGDTIMTLQMKSLDLAGLRGTIKMRIDYEISEFADKSAQVIEDVVLEIPEIGYLLPDNDDPVGVVYPNPFDDYAAINFYLKEESQVKISLFNMAGSALIKPVENTYQEGTHQYILQAIDFAKGIYLLKFEIRNSEGSSSKLIKILVTG
jgi:hypothetical protein